jgi:hypothetical protein
VFPKAICDPPCLCSRYEVLLAHAHLADEAQDKETTLLFHAEVDDRDGPSYADPPIQEDPTVSTAHF